MRHIFIIGSRGLPAKYGGFETFVSELVKNQQSAQLRYHVACLSDQDHHRHFDYQGADCFTIKAPNLGPARVIAYDMMAINYALSYIKKHRIEAPIFYILGNTIGGFMGLFARRIKRLGGQVLVNPDGLEWKRAKWSKPVQAYLKLAEKGMSRQADLLIADNQGIESYLKASYPWARTDFIAYGTDLILSTLSTDSQEVVTFFSKWQSKTQGYYLILGRFVPENNYETMIREFMKSPTKRDLLIICNHEGSAYFKDLEAATGFSKDPRIKFVGTVYDQELLKFIREQAFAYIHGHEVGGTNPGLLEALAHTNLNLVLGVDFNRQVALDMAHYWTKDEGALSRLIGSLDKESDFADLGQRAKAHMTENYTWPRIVSQYEELFLRDD